MVTPVLNNPLLPDQERGEGDQCRRPRRQAGDHPVAAVAVREGSGRVPRDEAPGVPAVLLCVVQRPARHPVQREPAAQGGEAPHQTVRLDGQAEAQGGRRRQGHQLRLRHVRQGRRVRPVRQAVPLRGAGRDLAQSAHGHDEVHHQVRLPLITLLMNKTNYSRQSITIYYHAFIKGVTKPSVTGCVKLPFNLPVFVCRHYMTDAVAAYEDKPRDQWLFDYPAQVSLCGTQIWWTAEVGIAFGRLEVSSYDGDGRAEGRTGEIYENE